MKKSSRQSSSNGSKWQNYQAQRSGGSGNGSPAAHEKSHTKQPTNGHFASYQNGHKANNISQNNERNNSQSKNGNN